MFSDEELDDLLADFRIGGSMSPSHYDAVVVQAREANRLRETNAELLAAYEACLKFIESIEIAIAKAVTK